MEESQEVVLRCELSDEDAAVIWVKDGRKLSPTENLTITATGKTRALTIKSARPEDSGTYRCETTDGRSRAEGEVTVKGKFANQIFRFGSENTQCSCT